MKDSHIYQRMNNPSVVKIYLNMIKMYELDIVHELYNNITMQADDHPRYNAIQVAYNERLMSRS